MKPDNDDRVMSRTLGKAESSAHARPSLMMMQLAAGGSATTGRRKPVPTPRNTLKKPTGSGSGTPTTTRRDSQGQASLDSSTSPDENTTTTTTAAADSKQPSNGNNGCEDGEDILAALEKIPGVGSLRSVAQSSIGSSLPSLAMDKFKREESSHSLGSQLSDGLNHPRRFHTAARLNGRGGTINGGSSSFSASASTSAEESKTSSPLRMTTTTKCSSVQEEENMIMETEEDGGEEDKTDNRNNRSSMVQTRPLPELPKVSPKSTDDISVMSSSASASPSSGGHDPHNPTERVYSTLLSPDHYSELQPPSFQPMLTTPRKGGLPALPTSETASLLINDANSNRHLTMTGTMRKGGRKKMDKERIYDIQMSLTREQVAQIEKKVHDKHHDRCFCGCQRGVHILAFSLLCLPFCLLAFTFNAFYLATITWYNVFLHYNEERSCCHKLMSPFVLLAYPLWIVPVTIGLGLFGGFQQLSWYWDGWLKAVKAPDGGFLGWVCNWLEVPECAPYQVVLLTAQEEYGGRPRCAEGRVADL